MNGTYHSVAGGLRLIFIANILLLAGRILLSPFFASILLLAGLGLELAGLFAVNGAARLYRVALLVALGSAALNLLAALLADSGGLLLTAADMVCQALDAVRVWLGGSATAGLLLAGGNEALVRRARPTWIVFAACTAAAILLGLLSPLLPNLAAVYVTFSLLYLAALILGRAMYILFLGGAVSALK